MESRDIKPIPSRKGKGKSRQKDLPLEVILDILKRSAWSTTTINARNMCLVSKAAYDNCWPALHRIVALRSASQLQKYSRRLVEGSKRESAEQHRERQAALHSLYINNTPADALTHPGSASCLTIILTVARNIKICHFEEHWSDTSSFMKNDKPPPARLLKNPLRHIACFPAVIGKVRDNGSNTAFAQLPPKETRKAEDWVHLVPKLTELTISAHTIADEYLHIFQLYPEQDGMTYEYQPWYRDTISKEEQLGANYAAFSEVTHLHIYFANLDNGDNMLLNFIVQLPKLTHLRLSRPVTEREERFDPEGDTEYLADISHTILFLLERRLDRFVKMQSIILQLGSNFDRRVLYHMTNRMKLERQDPRVRLIYTKAGDSSHSVPYRYASDGEVESQSDDDSGDDSDTPLANIKNPYTDEAITQLFAKVRAKSALKQARAARAFSIANTKADTDAKCEKLAFYQFAKRAGGGEGIWARDCMTLW